MNTTTEKITESASIYGIHRVMVDNKQRISIPNEWRELLTPGSYVHILNAGFYLLIIPKDLHKGDPDSIIHEHQIEANGRVLIGKKLLTAFNIKMDGYVHLIGKGNHLELYWDQDNLQETIARSQRAVATFQADLISLLQNKRSS